MAVAFDAVGPSSAGASSANSLTLSWTHTCSGVDRIVFVSVALGIGSDTTATMSATYGGVAMTSIGVVHADNQTAGYVQMWYLVNPPTGSASVVVTKAGSGGTPVSLVGGSVSLTGVDQNNPVGVPTSALGAGTSGSVALASTTAGNMIVDAICNGGGIASSGQTSRWLHNANNATAAGNGASSTAPAGGNVTMSYTLANDWWGILAVEALAAPAGHTPTTYYVSATGSDSNDGLSTATPWATVGKVNAAVLGAGDQVLFKGGDTFTDAMLYLQYSGTASNPITIGSYGAGKATLGFTGNSVIYAYDVNHVAIENFTLSGTSAYDTLSCYADVACSDLTISNVAASGGNNGIALGGASVGGFDSVTITGCETSGCVNGFFVYGPTFTPATPNYAHSNLTVESCVAHDNPGNAANTAGNTGSGIIVSSTDGATIHRCSAYNNGANNAYTGNGPVGIWAYAANAVTIDSCLSYNNTSGTVADGGGFDLDIDVANSVIEYSLAYGNKGPGFLLFGDIGNTAHANNVVRYNLSWGNAKNTSLPYGEIAVYPGTQNDEVYNNTVVARDNGTTHPSALYIPTGTITGLKVRNNVLASQSGPVVFDADADAISSVLCQGNDYHSTGGGALANWGGTDYLTLAAWRAAIAGQEQVSGSNAGFEVDPQLVAPATAPTVTDPADRTQPSGLKLAPGSQMAGAGLDLATLFGTSIGSHDYYGSALTAPYSVGAAEGTVYTQLDGTASATDRGTGHLGRLRPVAGTADAAAASTGALGRTRALSGTASAAQAAGGALTGSRALTGASTASTDGSGAISPARGLAGTSSTAADGQGRLDATRTLDASATASAAGSGSIDRARALDGSASSATGATGSIDATRRLDGSSLAAAGTSAALGAVRGLDGVASASSVVTGDFGGSSSLDGIAPAAGSTHGSLSGQRALDGTAGASGSASGTLGRLRPMGGVAGSANSALGTLTLPGAGDLAGAARGASSAQGTLVRARHLLGTSPAASAVQVALSRRRGLPGKATAASVGSGALDTRRVLVGAARASAGAAGSLSRAGAELALPLRAGTPLDRVDHLRAGTVVDRIDHLHAGTSVDRVEHLRAGPATERA